MKKSSDASFLSVRLLVVRNVCEMCRENDEHPGFLSNLLEFISTLLQRAISIVKSTVYVL